MHRLLVVVLGDGLSGDTVKITLTVLRNAAATVLRLLDDVKLLEGLEDTAVDGARGVLVVGGASTTVLGGAVALVQAADTDVFAEVDVAGNRSSALVEPVLGLEGRELLGDTGLDDLNVARNLELGLTTQEGSIGVDKILCGNVADSDARHFWITDFLGET